MSKNIKAPVAIPTLEKEINEMVKKLTYEQLNLVWRFTYACAESAEQDRKAAKAEIRRKKL